MVNREQVEQWLREAGIETLETTVEDPDRDVRWSLAFHGGAFHTLVVHEAVEWNHLVMQVNVGIAEEHQEVLRALPRDDRDRFIHDLRITMLQQEVGYSLRFEDDDAEAGILGLLSVGLNVYDDPMDRALFFQRNSRLQTASLLGVQLVKKLARFEAW